jgi:hypothetical protein
MMLKDPLNESNKEQQANVNMHEITNKNIFI